MQTGSFTERLPCVLTPAERLQKSEELVTVLGEKEELEDRKESAAKAFKRQITVKDETAKGLAQEIRTGIEYRDVDCHDLPVFARNLVDTVRNDTGEVVRSRAMRADERQEAIAYPEHESH